MFEGSLRTNCPESTISPQSGQESDAERQTCNMESPQRPIRGFMPVFVSEDPFWKLSLSPFKAIAADLERLRVSRTTQVLPSKLTLVI